MEKMSFNPDLLFLLQHPHFENVTVLSDLLILLFGPYENESFDNCQ